MASYHCPQIVVIFPKEIGKLPLNLRDYLTHRKFCLVPVPIITILEVSRTPPPLSRHLPKVGEPICNPYSKPRRQMIPDAFTHTFRVIHYMKITHVLRVQVVC